MFFLKKLYTLVMRENKEKNRHYKMTFNSYRLCSKVLKHADLPLC